jgi:hypothetical protein
LQLGVSLAGRIENLKPWTPGQSGNPRGRPRKRLLDEALEDLLASNDSRAARDVAVALVKKARKGDIRAIQLLAERTQGKPMRAIEISGPDGGALEIDHMTDQQLDQRINELMAKVKTSE